MKLVSWNVMRGGTRIPRQIEALASLYPDIVALQEVTASSIGPYREAFRAIGLNFMEDTLSTHPDPGILVGPRRYGVLIASTYPMDVRTTDTVMCWPERFLSVAIESLTQSIGIHNAYIPQGSTNGLIKIETLEGIFKTLAHHSLQPRALCGDFNASQFETAAGDIITWAQRISPDGTIKKLPSKGVRWDAGERNIIEGLRDYDLQDTFRLLNGYRVEEFSWYLKRRGKVIGRRFDHVYASRNLRSVSCRYLHELREQGLSDHSPVEVCFTLG